MIKKSSIEQIKEIADIIEVVQACNVDLVKSGSNYHALCPFHSEKSPSFIVNQTDQYMNCFGCGVKGDIFTFLKELIGLQFPDAVEWLAKMYNVALEYDESSEDSEMRHANKKAWTYMDKVKRHYHSLLMSNDLVRAYLNARGITDETIQLWQIGYAPANWRTMTEIAVKDHEWALAVNCGVCVEKEGNKRDFFYNRIITPIHDHKGNCISFAGRIWTEEQNGDPKYLNGCETHIYKKEDILFGMHLAKMAISKSKEAILVEGYFDAIRAHQEEITNTVAACGTSVTLKQVQSLVKNADTIILAGDNDPAGQASIIKCIDLCYGHGASKVDVIEWPNGIKDIEEFIIKNKKS